MKPLAVFILVSLFGCYSTYQVPVEQLYNVSLRNGVDTRVKDVDGDDVVISQKSEITFETVSGQQTKLQLATADVTGNTLAGRLKNGAPVQIELPQIAGSHVRNFSALKTGLLAGGGAAVLLAGIIVLAVLLSSSGDGGFESDFR